MTKPKKIQAIVLRQVELAPQQIQAIQKKTPEIYVKTRIGRGKKDVKYVEVGYVINTLNEVLGTLNWDFEVLDQGKTERKNEKNAEGEVWVRGRLTILDHKNNFKVSKTQYGQHNIHVNVPIGDAFKAASSDSLKKCASMFGIGLDLMWNDGGEKEREESKAEKKEASRDPKVMFETAKKMIGACRVPAALMAMDDKIQSSKVYSKEQKVELQRIISARVDFLDANQA